MAGCRSRRRGAGELRDKDPRQESRTEIPKKAMRKHGKPEVVVTVRLWSYGAILKDLGAGDRQETGRWLNNRI